MICHVKKEIKKKFNIEKILLTTNKTTTSYLDNNAYKIKLGKMTTKELTSKRNTIIISSPTILENEVPDDKIYFDFQNKNINIVEELSETNDTLFIETQITL